MKLFFNITINTIASIILFIIVLPLVISLFLQSNRVQNFVIHRLESVMSEKIETKVSIDRVDITFFYKADIRGFYVEDPTEGDTLLYVNKLNVFINTKSLLRGALSFRKVTIEGGKFYLNLDSTLVVNVKRVTDHLKPKKPKIGRPVFEMEIEKIELDSFDFHYRKFDPKIVEYGVNFEDMYFDNINADIDNFYLLGDSITAKVNKLAFIEKSGVRVKRLSTDLLIVSPSLISTSEAFIEIDQSTATLDGFKLIYSKWNMADFINNVVIQTKIKESNIHFNTIEQFTGKDLNWRSVIDFQGYVSGTIAHLSGQVSRAKTLNTSLVNVDFMLTGLPNVASTTFDVNIKEVNTSPNDLAQLYNEFTGKKLNNITRTFRNVSRMNFSGKFKGLFSSFFSAGKLNTNVGNLNMNLELRPITKGGYDLSGSLDTKGVDIGRLFSFNRADTLAFKADVKGYLSDDSLSVETNANISKFNYNGYSYSDIIANGDLINRTFRGFVGCTDEYLDFIFNGFIDLTDIVPSYDFSLKVNNADLCILNINHRDSVSLLSTLVKAHGSGTNIDDLNADILIDKLVYINHMDTVNSDQIHIVTQNTEENKYLSMTSHFADIELKGKQSYKNMFVYFENTVKKYLPSLQKGYIEDLVKGKKKKVSVKKVEDINEQSSQNSYYLVKVDVKKANNVAAIFVPGLNIAQGTNLSFIFNPAINEFSLSFASHNISRDNISLKDINIDSKNQADSISVFMRCEEALFGNIFIPNLSVIGSIKNNNISLYSRFANKNDGSGAFLRTKSVIGRNKEGAPHIDINILPSYFTLGKKFWQTSNSHVIIDSTEIEVKNLQIYSESQPEHFNIDGIISKNQYDTISLKINSFDIAPFSLLTEPLGYAIAGKIDGGINFSSLLSNPSIISDIKFNGIKINEYTLNNTTLSSSKHGDVLKYSLTAADTLISGEYYQATKKYFARIGIKDIDLSMLSPLMSTISDHTKGSADIRLTADNNNNQFSLNGEVDINNFETRLLFTKVGYKTSGKVMVKDNQFSLLGATVYDELGHTAQLKATLSNNNFKNLRYNINLRPNKMLCFNTTNKDSDLFYGKIFASGNVDITGKGRHVVMDVTAKTENKSSFFMPLSNKTNISAADFIKFKTNQIADTTQKRNFIISKPKSETDRGSSFAININADIRSNTEVQIVIDPTIGNVIKGRGNGLLMMNSKPREGLFTINGLYEITEGSYLFTLRNIINKHFVIQPGSTISWNGDPLNANLNITATYAVKASLAPLLGNMSTYARRVNVDCNLTLMGRLLQPDIKLGVTVPSADPETQSLIAAALNTEEAVSMQLFWLLFANTFFADNTSNASNVNIGIMSSAVTGIEFLSNQLSNWLSSDKFNFGINYRPRSELTSDEVELSVSAPILNNKLYLDVEGNYNAKNNTTTSALNTLSGDFYLTWLLNYSGNLRAKAFSRTITTFDENQGLQESGVGVYYKDDFNRFRDLIKRYKKSLLEYKNHRISVRNQKDTLGHEAYHQQQHQKRVEQREDNKKARMSL